MAIHVESITTKFGTANIKKLEAKVKAKGLPWFKLEKGGNHV